MKFSKIIILAVVLVVVLAVVRYMFFPPGLTTSRRADIQLTISAAGLKFTGASGDHGNCQSTNNTYCVRVPHGDDAELTFRLVGQPNWEFSRMQLVAEPSDKLDFGAQAGFTQAMIDDFYVTINGVNVHPDGDGIIDLDGPPGVGRDFILIDNNELTQTYKYQLEVCNGDECESSDPKVENDG